MVDKTNRQKCIEMWQWIVDNESDKEAWADEHPEEAKVIAEYVYCHACLEAKNYCNHCPVLWGCENACCSQGSPYMAWLNDRTKENAKAVLDVIDRTWEEK